MSKTAWTLVSVWLALMILLTATVAATFGPFGALKPLINLAIAFAKAGLIFWVFMHVREQGPISRLVVLVAPVWLLLLIILSQADVLTRAAFTP